MSEEDWAPVREVGKGPTGWRWVNWGLWLFFTVVVSMGGGLLWVSACRWWLTGAL
jgi:hypothetical protein